MSALADWLCAISAAAACGAVSPIIVQRRWGFVGEAIGHSGFGGAGAVWLVAAALPAVEVLRSTTAASVGVLAAAVVVAAGIGLANAGDDRPADVDRGRHAGFDTVVGVFLVGTLALGLFAASAFDARFGFQPARADVLLFGGRDPTGASAAEALASLALAAAVVVGLAMFRREILAWATDPPHARLYGIATGRVRVGVLVATAVAAALSARWTGAILVTATLVLPGAVGVRLGRSLVGVWLTSLAALAAGLAVAVLLQRHSPPGATTTAVLLAALGLAVIVSRRRGGAA